MPTIDDLSQTSAVTGEQELALYLPGPRATRKATLAQVAGYMQQALAGEPDETIYSVSTDAITVLPATPGGYVWARLDLTAPAPNATVILPGIDDRQDGQEVLVTCTQTVTALTITGGAVIGAPASIGPTTPFRLKFDLISLTWNRIS